MALINQAFVQSAVKVRSATGKVAGTGFGYARPDMYNSSNPALHTAEDDEPWRIWLVTCAHVIDDIEASGDKSPHRVHVEINEEGAEGRLSSIIYPIGHYWTRHKKWIERCSTLGPIGKRRYTLEDAAVDVAVTTLPTKEERFRQLDWWGFPPKTHMTKTLLAPEDSMNQPLSEGDGVFVIGFPLGFHEDVKNWPIVRQGVLAQIQSYLRGSARIFLIDGSVFGGNSGGPVVTKPESTYIKGTPRFMSNALVGMVSGCRVNPSNSENAHLGIVIPVDTINETIETALAESGHLNQPYPQANAQDS